MRTDDLIARVTLHAPLSPSQARAAVAAVLTALGEELGRPEADALAAELPAELAAALHDRRTLGGGSLAERVARREHTAVGEAREQAGAVAGALAELLPAALVERLQSALSAESASWLTAPSHDTPAPHVRASRDTLAEGRPGSRHPLSEARPADAQADSVAVANPHGDTKLSSSRGLTQEREGDTLADGQPGSRRPLSDGD